MAYASKLKKNEIIIDDTTPVSNLKPPSGQGKGLQLGKRMTGFGKIYGAPPLPNELLIDESEWQDRIEEMEKMKTRLSDLVKGLPPKSQGNSNFCWCNSPVYAMEVLRIVQNQKPVRYSPASVGGPIKNFKNVGGYAEESVRYLVEHGVVEEEFWPANAIDAKYYTEENRERAKKNLIIEWWELEPRNIRQLMSVLLRRMPVCVGLNWWRHEVTYEDPIWLNGKPGFRFRNNWGDEWGDHGYGILQDSKMVPDDCLVPRLVTAS